MHHFTVSPELFAALVGFGRSAHDTEPTEQTFRILLDALEGAAPERTLIDALHAEKAVLAPDCAACPQPCGRRFDYDGDFSALPPEVRAIKGALLARMQAYAPTARRALEAGTLNAQLPLIFYRTLFALGEDWMDETDLQRKIQALDDVTA